MKKGFTLVELLITVGLFVIIITIAVGGFTNAIRTQRQVSSLISAESNVSLSLEQMARQIRTGYLFCNTYKNETAVAGGNPIGVNPDCNCQLSSALSPSAPSSSWTCDDLEFRDAGQNIVLYERKNGALMEDYGTTSTAALTSVTGNAVLVKYLTFQLFGQVEGDHWTPRVTISMGIAPSSTDPAVSGDVVNLQTTVSARTIDCDTTVTPAQC
jgi:prepilin-type N-terminal cleavage/methylation domain-containing protein